MVRLVPAGILHATVVFWWFCDEGLQLASGGIGEGATGSGKGANGLAMVRVCHPRSIGRPNGAYFRPISAAYGFMCSGSNCCNSSNRQIAEFEKMQCCLIPCNMLDV